MDLIYRYDPFAPIVIERPTDPASAVHALLDGNRRLIHMVRQMQMATLGDEMPSETIVPVNPVSMGLPFWPGAALDQKPFAMVLGCSDARVPLESVFDQAFNGMFVVRVAGNVLGTEGLGSFDYAVRHLGHSLQVVVVMGHTGCGAVTAAVDTYLAPNEYADIAYTHALRTLVGRVMFAVRGAAKTIDRRCGHQIHTHPDYRAALIDVAVYLNAAINAFDLCRQIKAAGNAPLAVYYCVCDLKSMIVSAMPVTSDDAEPELRPAPKDSHELVDLGGEFLDALIAGGLLA